MNNKTTDWLLFAFATVGLCYIYVAIFVYAIVPLNSPCYYEWMQGRSMEGVTTDYSSDFLDYWFSVVTPLSLVLGSISALLIKNKCTEQHKKIFRLLGITGGVFTAYILIRLLT